MGLPGTFSFRSRISRLSASFHHVTILDVDPVTHTLVGVAVGNAFFRKSIGKGTAPIMAIASNLPDVDAIVHLTGDPTAILMRRTFGHSLILIPFLAMGLAYILRRFYPHISFGKVYAMTLLAALVHVFFDLVNSFGVVLLWPLIDWRPEFAIIFIIDLIITGLVLLPLCLCLPPFMRRHIVPYSRVAIACVALYVGFCASSRNMAGQALAAESDRTGQASEFLYIFPEAFGPHRWRGVSREGNTYHLYLIHPLSSRIESKGLIQTQRGDPTIEEARETRLAKRLERFFKAPVWQILAGPEKNPAKVSVYDLRFHSVLIPRGPSFLYRFYVHPNGRVEYASQKGEVETLTILEK